MTKEKADIDYRFKILYMLAIIMVLTGHSKGGGISLLFDWFPVQAVHLGIFMFASGYFYKQEAEEKVGNYIWKKIKRLIIPMYVYNLAYGLIRQIIAMYGPQMGKKISFETLVVLPITTGNTFGYNQGGWFIVPLFMVEVTNVLLRKGIKKVGLKVPEGVFFVSSFILGMCGVYLASIGYREGWWLVLVRWLYFLPFYYLGIFYKRVLERYDVLPGTIYFSIIFGAKLIVALWLGRMPTYTPSLCNDFVDGPIAPFIVCILGIAFWLRVSRMLEPVLGRNKYVNLIADNTYSIMMNHLMGFLMVNAVYAMLAKTTIYFPDFDWKAFGSSNFYAYALRGVNQTKVIYIIVGIGFSIWVQFCINKIKNIVMKSRKI